LELACRFVFAGVDVEGGAEQPDQRFGAPHACVDVAGEAALDHVDEGGAEPGYGVGERWDGPVDDLGDHHVGGAGGEGAAPREHLEEQDPERPEVRASVDVRPIGLLRAHVRRRSHQAGRDRARLLQVLAHPEVEHLDDLARALRLAVQEHVGRLEVAVDDAPGVGDLERGSDGDGDLDRRGGGEVPDPLEAVFERLPREPLHDQEGVAALRLADVVDVDDVPVLEGAHGAGLAEHAGPKLGGGAVRQLDGDRPAGGLVHRSPDFAHPSTAEDVLQAILRGEEIPGLHAAKIIPPVRNTVAEIIISPSRRA
jgi:hypothetical protein